MADANPSNPEPSEKPESEQPAAQKPRKRRRWPWVLLGLFLFIVLLVALAPSIASTGIVRSIVVGKINENLNGTVEIADWSLGWFSPTTVSGVKVYDDQKRMIVDIPRIKLGLSVLSALRNNFALGNDNQIDVDSFIVHLDETGKTNLEKLPRTHGPRAPKPAEPVGPAIKLPDISGKFTVNFHGTIEGSVMPVPVQIDPSTAIVNITDINKPIESSVKLAYHVGDRAPSIVETSGSITTVKDNILNIAELAGGQKIDLKNVDLAGLEPILRKFGVDAKLAGVVTGGIQVKAEGLTGLSADGQIVVQNLVFSGGPIGADSFKTSQLSIPVKITRISDPATKKDYVEFQNVGLKMDQATVTVTGKVTQQSLMNLSQGKGPGDDGSITIAADVSDLKNIAGQLSNTLHLQQGVSITGGSIHEQINVALTKDQIRLEQNLKAEAQGQQGDRQIVLKPIEFTAGLSATPTGKTQTLPDFHDLKLSLNSDFATFSGGGTSLAKVDLNGNFDLGKLRNEVGQFADLGSIQLQGTGTVAINANGDVTDATAPIDLKTSLNLQNVKIAGISNFDVDQDKLTLTASGKLDRQKGSLTDGQLLFQTSALNVAINKQNLISNETISASIAGSVTNSPDKLAANISTLSINTQSNLFALNKSGDGPANFALLKGGAVQGNANLTLAADLPRLATILQNFSGQPALANQPQLRGGQLNGTITVTQADQTKVDLNGQITGLTVFAQGKNAIENEQVSLALNAAVPSDSSSAQPIVVSGKIGSSFVNTTLSNVQVLASAALFDKLRSGTVEMQVPNLPKLYALSESFMPAAPSTAASASAAPMPPLQLDSGNATLKATIARDTASKTTTLSVTDVKLDQLIISRGKRQYGFAKQPVNFNLKAAVVADTQIDSLKVDQLSLNSGVVTIDLPEALVVDHLSTAQPTCSGQLKISGRIDAITPLLAVLQNADAYPVQGNYQLTQQIATAGDTTSLNGSLDVNAFKVIDAKTKKASFSEDQIALRNDVALNLAQHNAQVKTLTIDMAQSKALGVKLTGQINDWEKQRTITGLGSDPQAKLDLTYDLEKIWTIIYPMLPTQTQQDYKNLKVTGKFTRGFTVSGAYPEKPAFEQSIASMNADGSFAIGLLDLPQGLTFKSFELPFTIKNGVLQTKAAPKDDARKLTLTAPDAAGRRATATPRTRDFMAGTAVANDGALGLDGMTLDLTLPDPLLSVTPKQVVLRDVKLNPVLADNLGKMGAMIMTNASTAQGLVTLTVVKCDRVPLGSLIQKKQDADAQITLAVDKLLLDGPVPKVLAAATDLGTSGIQGSIPTSTITLKNGRADTDLTVQIDKQVRNARGQNVMQGSPMKFVGGLMLADLTLKDFTVTIPPDLILGDLKKVFPNGAVLALKGTANKPQLDLEKAVRENALKNLIPGGSNNNGSGKGGDILNNLLNGGKNQKNNNGQ